ncbi:Cyclin dependent kinase 10 [Paragonimus skrjabini miyazakii]|uniref:Cyclin dependent kinase 10 n=1 Tax=Paragonimus skrjabini miyazakii TaxID=59628 RepID=A0A8S9Z455_9TREM|nr:Cyclin dependent kinase 10 [Paragonimus skrjabini miyazakii]
MEKLMDSSKPSNEMSICGMDSLSVQVNNTMNGNTDLYSSSDSDSEYRRRNIFPLKSQRLPRDSLKFILTVWYSPETSSVIAESISNRCNEVQLKRLIGGSPRDILRLAAKCFNELDI